MKHGVHIPVDKRQAMARRAWEISCAAETRNQALIEIAAEMDVSMPTARNLIALGGRLASGLS